MSIVVGLVMVVLLPAAWLLVKRYERHFNAQIGPWIVSEMKPQRSRQHLAREHRDDSDR
ncbi:hypothetical protein SAMN03159423_2237 [Bradyrhizobium sp. NFR13]|uniref:hypothetical protein n=1 Tax=Bradyrhizobium sp. NFR13 TaxID=1566285 RepID=UPI0008EB0EE8|nr:hypothetical protein [Bradyrhizobium sp. NFR13]SFL52483.1 hypothetical protein SAMN03159423_2237 [Bradyrhizobium sp. NFR13]